VSIEFAQVSDEELYKSFADGDRLSFEELLNRHQEPVYRLAFRITGNSEEARDIAEEVFINLWENPASYRPVAKFSTWLYRVTSNRSITHIRFRKFRSFFSLSEESHEDQFPDQASDRPDHLAEKADESSRVNRALLKLPPRQRAAIHLRYFEDLSVAEVAEAMELSLKSAESLLFRGKQALRDSLKERE